MYSTYLLYLGNVTSGPRTGRLGKKASLEPGELGSWEGVWWLRQTGWAMDGQGYTLYIPGEE